METSIYVSSGGPTGCGKTQFTIRLIEHAKTAIKPSPEKILWCYGVYQDAFRSMPGIEFKKGIPELTSFDGKKNTYLSWTT